MLNERAAKCMGWVMSIDDSFDELGNTRYPDRSLDDAALVRDRAIEKCGFSQYAFQLLKIVFPEGDYRTSDRMIDDPDSAFDITLNQLRGFLTATPAQITEAACRCLEAATPTSPSPKP